MIDPYPWWQFYAGYAGMGLVWIAAHCAGMCGPLLVGCGFHAPELAAVSYRQRVRAVVWRVLCYQTGRALVYAGLGALAGWFGARVAASVAVATPWLSLVVAAGLFVAAWRAWQPRVVRAESNTVPSFAMRLTRWVGAHAPATPALRAGCLGMSFAFLPCGIVWWALSLAMASAAPLTGALLLVVLVVLTTPALLLAAGAPLALLAAPVRWRAAVTGWAGRWLPPVALAVSGLLLGASGLAALFSERGPHCH